MRGNRDIFSGKKVYTIERLFVDKNIGLVNTGFVNACNIR